MSGVDAMTAARLGGCCFAGRLPIGYLDATGSVEIGEKP